MYRLSSDKEVKLWNFVAELTESSKVDFCPGFTPFGSSGDATLALY